MTVEIPAADPTGVREKLRLTTIRSCRLCGCTDERACPGGCAWAFDDVCTSCIGHTPASWAAFRGDSLDDEAQPPLVRLIGAMKYAAEAIGLIGEHVAHLSTGAELYHDRPARVLALALTDVLGAAPDLDPPQLALVEALTGYLYGDDDPPDPAEDTIAGEPSREEARLVA